MDETTVDTEDARQARLTKAAAEAMGQWFIEAGILRKPVGSLNFDELSSAAVAAISGWLHADSRERAQRQPLENTSRTLI